MKFSSITENRINFRISEYMTIGLSVGKKTGIFINDDELNAETTLESLFISYCSYCKQKLLSCSLETSKNLDKFVELDVVKS
jgi:hypothetical protein